MAKKGWKLRMIEGERAVTQERDGEFLRLLQTGVLNSIREGEEAAKRQPPLTEAGKQRDGEEPCG